MSLLKQLGASLKRLVYLTTGVYKVIFFAFVLVLMIFNAFDLFYSLWKF